MYTTGEIGNPITDLVMIVARASSIDIEEIDAAKVGGEDDLSRRMQAEGLPLTYPVLETAEGLLITESPAIC